MQKEQTGTEYHVQNNNGVENTVVTAARHHYAEGKYKESLKLLLDVARLNSDSDIYVDIGNCFFMLNDYSSAVEYYNKAIEVNSKNSSAYANLGNLYYKLTQIEKAVSLWLVALISRPEDSQTCLNLAIAFNKKKMRFEAIKYFEKYLKYSNDRSSTTYIQVKKKIENCSNVANQYLAFGVQSQSEKNYKKAAACYFKSLANYPNLSKANLNLGSIFFSDKNLELAIKYWMIALYIDSKYDKIYSNLAISYDMMKQFDYAYCYYYQYMNFVINNKVEYDKANRRFLKLKVYLKENPQLIEPHLEKAQNHLANNRIYEAIAEFRNYSILRPEKKDIYKNIIKKLESYIKPEDAIIKNCFKIGDKLINESNYSEAKHYFHRIMKLSSPRFLEFSKAKAKLSQCKRALQE